MDKLELYIEQINAAKTPEEAFDQFCSIMKKYGYSRIAYSLVTDHPSLGLPRQHGLATSYPEDWMKLYTEKDYMKIDPVVKQVLTSRKPFFWSELTEVPDIYKPSLTLMNEAEEAGIHDGVGLSLCSTAGEIVGVGLARDEKSKGKDYQFLAAAYLLSVYFHETYRDLLSQNTKPILTTRETEVLAWATEGKTDHEISDVLKISTNTVRFHWKNIFRKLDANGKVYAVAKAIRLQLVSPEFVSNPYQNW